jgi:hypothetical protein
MVCKTGTIVFQHLQVAGIIARREDNALSCKGSDDLPVIAAGINAGYSTAFPVANQFFHRRFEICSQAAGLLCKVKVIFKVMTRQVSCLPSRIRQETISFANPALSMPIAFLEILRRLRQTGRI